MTPSDAREIAQEWRETQPENRATTGVALVFEGRVYGWKNELRDPHHERPGACAVDVEGRVWEAKWGDDQDGSWCWVEAHEPTPKAKGPGW
jgi:hypothetical protein